MTYTVAAPQLCHSAYLTSVLRLEFDTCNACSGWHEIDKIRVIGTTDAATGVAVVPSQLVFQPWAHTFGPPQVRLYFKCLRRFEFRLSMTAELEVLQ